MLYTAYFFYANRGTQIPRILAVCLTLNQFFNCIVIRIIFVSVLHIIKHTHIYDLLSYP